MVVIRVVLAHLIGSLIAFATIVPAHADGDAWDAYFVVNVIEEAVVTRGDKIARIEKPGFHTKLPLIEQVWFIAKLPARRDAIKIHGRLSDGSPCIVEGEISYRIGDTEKRFGGGGVHGFDMSKGRKNISDYTGPKSRVNAALIELLRETTPENAAQGAIEKWLGSGETIHLKTPAEDGTAIVDVRFSAVSCSRWKPPETTAACKLRFGERLPFARTEAWRKHGTSSDL